MSPEVLTAHFHLDFGLPDQLRLFGDLLGVEIESDMDMIEIRDSCRIVAL